MATTTHTCYEYPNVLQLNSLIKNWSTLPEELRKPKINWATNETIDQLTLLKTYKSQILKSRYVQVQFGYSKTSKTHGRQFARCISFQSMRKEFRHTLANGTYDDWDMKNAHPTIFSQYCDKNNYACPLVKSYVENRDALLAELGADGKVAVLALLNGGEKDYNDLENKPEWLRKFREEIVSITSKIVADPANAKYVKEAKAAKKDGKEWNVGGSVMNRILCDIENKCLMACKDHLFNKNIPTDEFVPVFDGFMIPRKYEIDGEKMNGYVADMTGYSLTLVKKPMNCAVDVPDVEEEEDEKRGIEDTGKFTNRTLFDYVVCRFPGRIKMYGGKVVAYDADTGLWTERALAIFSKLSRETFGGASGETKKMISDAFFFANELPDEDNFFAEAIVNSHGKLLFRDGVWDIKNSKRLPFDMKYYFGHKIDRNIPTKRDEDVVRRVRKVLFEDPHENPLVQNEMAKQLAVGLTGENLARNLYGNMGPTGTGKSTTQKAFKKAYGGFVGQLNSSHLTLSKYAGKNDHADYLVKLKYQRLSFISEIAPGEVWDGRLVKTLTGDDAISARKCGFGAEADFYSQATIFSYAQGMADIQPMDDAIRNRLLIVNWKVQFAKKEDGGNRDDSMIKWVETAEACDALFWVMKDAYELYKKEGFLRVEEISTYTSEIADEQDDFKREFESKFVKTRDGKMLIEEVYEILKNYSNKTTLITSKLTSMGIKKERVRNTGKWEGQQWAFVGLELKPVVCGFSHI